MNIEGKTALVTGSGRGIGRAIALGLARQGADVVVNYYRNEDAAKAVVDEITATGRRAFACRADVGNQHDVLAMRDAIAGEFGDISILVNNAGIIAQPAVWDQTSENEISRTIDTNLKGVIYCLQAFLPGMIKSRNGAVVNIASTYAITGSAFVLAYTASKAGVISITRAMAREMGKHGITVNAVAPGNVDTEMTQNAGADFIKWVLNTAPISRLGTTDEIANAVKFLIESDYITGHTLIVDGGHILNM